MSHFCVHTVHSSQALLCQIPGCCSLELVYVHCIQFGEFHTATLFNILHRQLCKHLRYTIILYLDRSPFSGTVLLDSWLLLTGAGLQCIYLGEFYTGKRFNRQHRIQQLSMSKGIRYIILLFSYSSPFPGPAFLYSWLLLTGAGLVVQIVITYCRFLINISH